MSDVDKEIIELVLGQCFKTYNDVKTDIEKHYSELKPKEKSMFIAAAFSFEMFKRLKTVMPKSSKDSVKSIQDGLEHFMAHIISGDGSDQTLQ